MSRVALLPLAFGAVLVWGCGTDQTSSPATDAPSTSVVMTTDVSTTTPPTGAPTTAVPTGDLTDPAQWIGRMYVESQMAAPYPVVSLDGVATDWVSALISCGMPSPSLPPACPAFVRADPGEGRALEEPGTWMLVLRRMDPQNATLPGLVVDALRVDVTEPSWMAAGMCSSTTDVPGVFVGFVQYDPTYMPTGVPEQDDAAHPLMKAWMVDGERLVEQPVDAVTCTLYSFGD